MKAAAAAGELMTWDINAPYKAESKKIVWEVAPYLRGRGVDLGAGDFKILPHAISVDNMNHAQFGFSIKPDVLSDVSKLDIFGSCSMDWVYSSHTLEHVEDMPATLKEWWRLVKQGGYLILYLPHKDLYPRMGQPGANPDHKRDLDSLDVLDAMPRGYDLIRCENRNQDDEYSFLMVFKKLNSKDALTSYKAPKPKKSALVVRYGAFGDVLQASSVIKGLKDLGYHVTMHASPPGSDVVAHDPNIDDLILFDKDQIPNGNLVDFWAVQKKLYTKFVNLSESVEGTFLSIPDRAQYNWPPRLRHDLMDSNYLEVQHQLAGVPHRPQVKFYPTDEEVKWAQKARRNLGPGPIIMWSLSGSSIHKTWAGLDKILASIMITYPTAEVVLVGGPECTILEAGWENESRIRKTAGKWTIRQTLSFLTQADLIIGPETGVLNAASCMTVPKIVFLSHSTVNNLTRDWINTTSLWGRGTVCQGRGVNEAPACHRMIYGWAQCTKADDGAQAQCQADISAESVWGAVTNALKTKPSQLELEV